jgi:hypothetical protein
LFSYPNGTADDFDDRDKVNLRNAGYVAALTQIAGLNDRNTDWFALKRLNIGRGHTPQLFIAQVSGFWPWMRSIAVKCTKSLTHRTEILSHRWHRAFALSKGR